MAALSSTAEAQRRAREAPAERASAEERAASSARAQGSVSVGTHDAGRLLRSAEVVATDTVRLKHPGADLHFGTDELVALIGRGAAAVAEAFPGSRLTVGDLSRPRGGRFRPHRSHRSGRDADIGFYIVDGEGALVYEPRFLSVRRDGSVRGHEGYRFDDARNWVLISTFVSQPDIPVQHVFVSREVEARVLEEGRRVGASEETLLRVETTLWQPSAGGAHRDHFHVRIYCSPEDRPRCRDEPPFHAWVTPPTPEQMGAGRSRGRARARVRARARARTRARARARTARRRRRERSEPAESVVAAPAAPTSDPSPAPEAAPPPARTFSETTLTRGR